MRRDFQQSQDIRTPYELRKTIRFVLRPKNIKRPYIPTKETDEDNEIKKFVEKYLKDNK